MKRTRTQTQLSVRPLGARVAVRPIDSDPSERGGLYIPETARDDTPQQGEVVAVGPGEMGADGKRLPMKVAVGDRVLFAPHTPHEFTLAGQELLLLDQGDVLGVIED